MRTAEKITILLTVILIALLGINMITPKPSDKLITEQINLQQLEIKKLDSLNKSQEEIIHQNRVVIQLLSNIDIEVTNR